MALDQIDVDEIDNPDKNMTFLAHLEELRWHLMRSVIAVGIGLVATFSFYKTLYDKIILAPLKADFPTFRLLCIISEKIGVGETFCISEINYALQNTAVSGAFISTLKVCFVAGLIIAFPYVIFEIWRFVSPALSKNEKKYSYSLIASCSSLFMSGVLFGYFVIIPICVNFFSTFEIPGVTNKPTIESYISFTTTIVLAAGIMFEMPVFSYFFSKIGLLTPQFLRAYRKHALIIMLVISAFVTPPDVFSQILLTLPLFFLYELSILISARVNKSQNED